MRFNTDALVYMPSIRGWELERMTFLCCCGLLVNHRSPQIKGQDRLLFDLPMNLQLWDSERSVGVFRKIKTLMYNLMHLQTVNCIQCGVLFFFFCPFGEYVNVCHLHKNHNLRSHISSAKVWISNSASVL